jgi:hypothetical protein
MREQFFTNFLKENRRKFDPQKVIIQIHRKKKSIDVSIVVKTIPVSE